MRNLNLSSLKVPALLITMLLLAASCARSPYNFVKVQPKKPFDRVAPAAAFSPGTPAVINSTALSQRPQADFKAPVINNSRSFSRPAAPVKQRPHVLNPGKVSGS
ncbi:hypothetical protein [Anseongella ginsenosidimutans]|uniref:hypothetical protein n=1 Tax=Anseongella ginsenosidimutans TaxID=496056 RepID=UPI0011CB248E|nr:hypothetical protein [Anseongella ginsenosidimutans]QEC51344.1 hypothetical protein FRZ59_02575 [Anseongella ginsenosidimutans]